MNISVLHCLLGGGAKILSEERELRERREG
jgi:hypothetical protein